MVDLLPAMQMWGKFVLIIAPCCLYWVIYHTGDSFEHNCYNAISNYTKYINCFIFWYFHDWKSLTTSRIWNHMPQLLNIQSLEIKVDSFTIPSFSGNVDKDFIECWWGFHWKCWWEFYWMLIRISLKMLMRISLLAVHLKFCRAANDFEGWDSWN